MEDDDAIEIELAVEEPLNPHHDDETINSVSENGETNATATLNVTTNNTTATTTTTNTDDKQQQRLVHNRVLSDLIHHFTENDMNNVAFREKFGISSTRITKFSNFNNQSFLFPENRRNRSYFDDDSEEEEEDDDDDYSSDEFEMKTPKSSSNDASRSTTSSDSTTPTKENLTMVVIHKPFELISKDANMSANGANGFIRIKQDSKFRLTSIEPNTPFRLKKKRKEYTRSDKLRLYRYHYNAKCYADRFMYSAEQLSVAVQTPSNRIVRRLLRPMSLENRKVRVISQYVYDKRNVELYKEQTLKWITGLPDHPNVVKYLDFEVDYVMNSAYNESHYVFWIILEDLLEPMMTKFIEESKGSGGACLEYKFLLDWMIQLASALEHLHKHDILHGNLQIDSIFVTNNQLNQIKLGNMQWISPNEELIESNQATDQEDEVIPYTMINRPPLVSSKYPGEGDMFYDKKAEVFSFGVLLLSICTLRKSISPIVNAFWGRDTVYIKQIYNLISKLYTKQLEGVLIRCCDYNPDKRPTMTELVDDLRRLKQLYVNSRSKSKSKSSTSYVDKIRHEQFVSEYGSSLDLFGSDTDVETPRGSSRNLSLPLALLSPDGPAYISSLLTCGKIVRKHVEEKYKKKRKFSIAGIQLMKEEGNKRFFAVRIVKQSGSPTSGSPIMNMTSDMFNKKPPNRVNNGMSLGMQSTREQELLRLRGSIQDYHVDDLINAGSQGRVYLAREKKTDKYCAIKRIELKNDTDIQIAGKEVSVMYDVTEQHTGFIRIYNWFLSTEPSTIYSGTGDRETWYMNIVLEFASGGDLRSRITEHRVNKIPFKVSTICRWLRQICSALIVIHQRKLMHRDLKPSNIFLTPSDKSHIQEPNKTHSLKVRLDNIKNIDVDLLDCRIGDMGLAIRTDELTRQNNRQGTEIYKSPEQHTNKKYNTSSDIWSLGCLAMEIITLEEHVDYYQKLQLDPDYVQNKLRDYVADERLTNFCLGCLQADQAQRPTAEELENVLKGEDDALFLMDESDEGSSFEENENDMIDISPSHTTTTTTTTTTVTTTIVSTENSPALSPTSLVIPATPKTPRTPRTPRLISSPRDKRRVTLTEFNDFIFSQQDQQQSPISPILTRAVDQFPNIEPRHKEKLHQLLLKKVETWGEVEVGVWLTTIGFTRYVELFKTQEIDGQALLYLPHDELEKIGVNKVGPRVKLWDAILKLREINKSL
jgi:serine/threonine protein kinase